MKPTQRDRGNHPGIVDYKGHSYVFGQNYDLMHLETFEHHERRSVSATEITYNADGTIQEVPYWLDQQPMKQLHWLNPYKRASLLVPTVSCSMVRPMILKTSSGRTTWAISIMFAQPLSWLASMVAMT